MNNKKAEQHIRFPLKGRISTVSMKVNVLLQVTECWFIFLVLFSRYPSTHTKIQCLLGNMKIDNFHLNQEMQRIPAIALRVCRCKPPWRLSSCFFRAQTLLFFPDRHYWEQRKVRWGPAMVGRTDTMCKKQTLGKLSASPEANWEPWGGKSHQPGELGNCHLQRRWKSRTQDDWNGLPFFLFVYPPSSLCSSETNCFPRFVDETLHLEIRCATKHFFVSLSLSKTFDY